MVKFAGLLARNLSASGVRVNAHGDDAQTAAAVPWRASRSSTETTACIGRTMMPRSRDTSIPTSANGVKRHRVLRAGQENGGSVADDCRLIGETALLTIAVPLPPHGPVADSLIR